MLLSVVIQGILYMFEGILSYFKNNPDKVQAVEQKAIQGLVNGHVVSQTVGDILTQLTVSFATMGFAYTVIGRHDLLLALASALIGQNHPKIQEHVSKVAKDVEFVTEALLSATQPVTPAVQPKLETTTSVGTYGPTST